MKRYFSAPKILEVTPILFLGLCLLIFPEIMLSQPPDFPLNPQQTPIDGGLTAVGLACGAYALRRLRRKS